MDAARLERVETNCSRVPDETCPTEFLDRLVSDGLLTHFQAEQFAQGRWQGFVVGEYRILARVGTGGMSQVFRAEHPRFEKPVAIKVLSQRFAVDPLARERFAREASAMAALVHPNIVRVLDVEIDETADIPYLVMEYIDGISLQAAVARHGTFSAGTAAFVARQVALGLQRMHEAGLVHRDIKPANVLLDREGLAKILDMGIVRVQSEKHLTRRLGEKTILGTADYLAPEQGVNSSDVDTRADLYALGSTLYFLLAGHPPFPDCTMLEKIIRKQKDDPAPIHRLRPDVPPALSAVVSQLLARKPDDRFSTPQAAAIALHPFALPDKQFPACLFEAARTSCDGQADTPTSVTCAKRAPSDSDLVTEPRTDIVPVDRPEALTGEMTAPVTARIPPRRFWEGEQAGLWLATSVLGFAIVMIGVLVAVRAWSF
jgi:serine/threonine-protein kinase